MGENILERKENEVVNTSNNSNNKNSIIAVLVVIIIVLIGVVVYFAFIKKDDKPIGNNDGSNQQVINNIDKTQENDNLKPWMKYILEQNITKIEVSKIPCSDDNFDKKTVTINVDQLKDIFKKFMHYQFIVSYTGGGGWDCGETLNIKYLKDGKEYKLDYLGVNYIVPSSDGCSNIYDKDLEKALDSSLDRKDNGELKDQDGICTMYGLATNDYLLDEYLK